MAGSERAKSILGYCSSLGARAGDTIDFHVHCDEVGEYSAGLVRIVCADETPGGAGFEEVAVPAPFAGSHRGGPQRTGIGSFGVVDLSRAALGGLGGSFTLQAMVQPTRPERGLQGILGTWSADGRRGVSLVLDDDGSAGLLFADRAGEVRVLHTGAALPARRWTLVSASYDALAGTLALRQRTLCASAAERFASDARVAVLRVDVGIPPIAGDELLFAALREGPAPGRSAPWATHHFDGKLERPRWSSAALSDVEVERLCETLDADALPATVVACWDFSRDIPSARLADLGPRALHGRAVNLPARAVTGCSWTGRERDWRRAPEQYGAIHFHADDLYDAGWEVAFRYTDVWVIRDGRWQCVATQSTRTTE